jgi:protein TonB
MPPPPPARPARKKPLEAKPPASTMAATDSVRTESPAPAPAPKVGDTPVAPVESVATTAASATAEPAPPPRAEIPVIHEARFREPPTPARYPPRAVDLNQQGTVIVRALVSPDGTSGDILVWRSSGYALLDAAALRAVRGWSFEPSSVGGRAITAWVEVPVRFTIR